MIWCVEDDASIRDIEVYALQSTGFEAKGFEDGQAFWNALQEEMPELVVLDVMLPGLDGITLLRRMKSSPSLFGVMGLVSCVKAVLRRCQMQAPAHLLQSGGISVDLDAHTVTANGQRVELTFKEFELLRLFLQHPGMAFTRDQLMEKVWGTDYYGETRTIDMHIRTLRQKLGPCGEHIATVRGVGYRWEGSK